MRRLPHSLSRRHVVLAAGVGGVALATGAWAHAREAGAAPEGEARGMEKATFILVHGAWHGGWCWRKVVPLLRAAGHAAHAPTLTGLGERVHLATPEVGLDTHVRDVLNLLEYEDLSGVVLVGHSYGGLVIASAAEHAPERLAHLVYLDADIREDGQAFV